MWIRSQDRKILTEIHNLDIDDINQIWDGSSLLGKYSSEEKALKVLDRIEELIENQCGLTFYMPADEEVKAWQKKDLDEFEKEFGFKLLPTSFKKPLSEITKEEYRERIEYLWNAIINDNSNEEDDF